MRFAVTASIMGGLSLTLILAGVGAVMRTGLLTWHVPVWSLIAVSGASLFLLVTNFVGRRPVTKRTFLIIPAFSQKHWVAELIRKTHRSLDRRGMDVVLKMPDEDYSAAGQMHHLRRILSCRDHYSGGFIVPVEVDHTRHDLRRFCSQLAKPVVMMDVEPFDDERDYLANSAFVGYDPAGIGECAAHWVASQLAASSDPEPTVLVVGSRAQNARQRRFTEVLRDKVEEAHIIVREDGQFARLRASAVVRRSLEQLRLDGRKLSVIFCTSDEMALGAIDALLADGSTLMDKVTVVGVDGTPEARALINTGHSPFRATVVQNSYHLSEVAADLFERMLKGERVPHRTLLRAELYVGDPAS
jgi:ribose transport system substrate-binding protein